MAGTMLLGGRLVFSNGDRRASVSDDLLRFLSDSAQGNYVHSDPVCSRSEGLSGDYSNGVVEPPILSDGRLSPSVFNAGVDGRAGGYMPVDNSSDLHTLRDLKGYDHLLPLNEGKEPIQLLNVDLGVLQGASSSVFGIDLDPSVPAFRNVNGSGEKVSVRASPCPISWAEQSGVFVAETTKGTGPKASKETEVSKQRRRKKKWIKIKNAEYNYVLGEDIEWEQVSVMVDRTLVGRAVGKHFALKTIVSWADAHWKSGFGYVPEVVSLSKGWFAFHFLRSEHLQWVTQRCWSVDNSPLLFKPWHPLFDASRERVDSVPLWVHLPSLSLQY